MKVNAVNFYIPPYLNHTENKVHNREIHPVTTYDTDMFVPSFRGINTVEPEKIEGIHCARCGKVTMSEKKYQQIMSAMRDAETGDEIYNVLEKNKNFIRKGYEFVPEDIKLKTAPKTPAANAITFVYNDIANIYADDLDESIDIMQDAMKTPGLSENDKQVLKDCVSRIIELGPDYKNYSGHHAAALDAFRKMNYKDRKILFQRAFMPAQRAYSFRKAMTDGGIGRINETDLKDLFTRTMFLNSVARAVPVNKNCDSEMPANKIVVCQECQTKCNHTRYYFSKADNYPLLKKNLLTYLRDLNFANKHGTINIPYDYVFKVAKYVTFKEPALALSSSDYGILKYQQQHPALPFEKFSNIPCPSCGVKMLSYDDYGKLEKTIAGTSKLTELTKIIQKNKTHISPDIYGIAKEYCTFVNKNPRLSDKMVKRHMYEFVTTLNHREINRVLAKINKIIENNNDLSLIRKSELLRLYDSIAGCGDLSKNVDIIDNREFEKIAENSTIIEPLDIFNLKYDILCAAEKIKTRQYLIFASKRMQSENRIWSEGFAKRLFKLSNFSTDHMESRYHGGSDKSHNLIGLCKKCNQSKKNFNFSDWYKHFVKTDTYIKSYLKKIKEYSDNGIVKGYEDYPQNIAENLFFLTDSAVDLRKEYPKK